MMVTAEQDQVVRTSLAAVKPLLDVATVQEAVVGTARQGATAAAH